MPSIPKLLISVVNAHEALQARDAGADIIDIKDPTRGPLGMPSLQTVNEIAAALPASSKTTLSLALGELIDQPSLQNLPPGITFAKAALANAPAHWPALFKNTFAPRPDITPVLALYAPMHAREAQALGQAFADPIATITLAKNAGAKGILIDTATKDGRSLLDTFYWPMLPQIITHTHSLGLWIALAGSLRPSHIPTLLPLNPDILGFRGGVCTNHNRNATIDPTKIHELKSVLPPSPSGKRPG